MSEKIHTTVLPDSQAVNKAVTAEIGHLIRSRAQSGQQCILGLATGSTPTGVFNEPGSGRDSHTRLITLDKVTRLDAAADFFGEQYVPRRAVTMGINTIMSAKRIIMIAFGEGKASVIAKAVEGPVTPALPASF